MKSLALALTLVLCGTSAEALEMLRGSATVSRGAVPAPQARTSDETIQQMTVTLAVGAVTCIAPGATQATPIADGDTIPEGSLIQTGPQSLCMIIWKNASVRAFANSNIRIKSVEHQISVLRGGSHITLNRKNTDTYEVRTPDRTAFLSECGTQKVLVGPRTQLIENH